LGCSEAENGLPVEYLEIAVPEGRLASEQARHNGRQLFLEHCALCHGERADGHGMRRSSLSTPPSDFTRADWRARVTARSVFYTIREGVRGTPMPAWKALGEGETWDIVAYVLSVAELGPEVGEHSDT
jgi:mono/diheme cytochrome c family protein